MKTVQGWVCGMAEQAVACIAVVQTRCEPWDGVSVMSAGRCDGAGWHAGQHDLAQDESKCVRAGSEFDLSGPPEKCCGTTCKVPHLHCGQDRLSADFCGSLRSVLLSGRVAWRWILHKARAWRRLRLASRPKWRILTKPAGRT